MAINLLSQYPGKVGPVVAGWPYGEPRNITLPGDGTGTPWEAALVKDIIGLQHALLAESSIVPTGTPENSTASQYLEALKLLLKTGRKNLLFGNFRINQRAVSGTVILLAGEYGHDRFRAGLGGCTYTFATALNITTITISAGTLEQEIEGENIDSDNYILSWSGTSQGQIDGGGFSTTGVTGTLVGGTNSIVEFDSGTLSLTQLEKGTVATEFEYRSISDELELCQRYLPAINVTGGNEGMYVGQCVSGTTARVFIPFKTTARVKPTGVVVSAPGDFFITNSIFAAAGIVSGIGSILSHIDGSTVTVTTSTGLSAGNATVLGSLNANAQLLFTGCEL